MILRSNILLKKVIVPHFGATRFYIKIYKQVMATQIKSSSDGVIKVVFEITVAVAFKVIFIWKYIFSFFNLYFLLQDIKMIQNYIKKFNLKQKQTNTA